MFFSDSETTTKSVPATLFTLGTLTNLDSRVMRHIVHSHFFDGLGKFFASRPKLVHFHFYAMRSLQVSHSCLAQELTRIRLLPKNLEES